MKKLKKIGSALVVCMVIGTVISACSTTSAPNDQIALAKAAVTDAVSAGAAEAAPLELALARQKLDKVNVALSAEDYDHARILAEQAQIDAKLAETKARVASLDKANKEVQQGVRDLQEEVSNPNRSGERK